MLNSVIKSSKNGEISYDDIADYIDSKDEYISSGINARVKYRICLK